MKLTDARFLPTLNDTRLIEHELRVAHSELIAGNRENACDTLVEAGVGRAVRARIIAMLDADHNEERAVAHVLACLPNLK